MTAGDAKAVLDAHRARLMKIPGVVGVSFGISPSDPGRRCILVHVTADDRPHDLPRELDGFDVEVVRVPGGFRAL
jgi:hypothetical protein